MMTLAKDLAIRDHRLAKPAAQHAALRDYDSVRRAIAFISEHWRAQPTIESMADAAGVTPDELHDLFVTHEAMSPGEWKTGGAGMTLRYGFHPSPFGTAIVIASGRGLAGLAFADPGEEQAALADRSEERRVGK